MAVGKLLRTGLLLPPVTPGTPPTDHGVLYVASDRPMFKDDGGNTIRMDNSFPLQYSVSGTLAVVAGVIPIPVPFAAVIEAVSARLGTSGTAVLDVNKNGTTIFTSTKVSFSASQTPTVGGFSVTSVSANDYFTVDVDSASGGAANCGLVVWLRRI